FMGKAFRAGRYEEGVSVRRSNGAAVSPWRRVERIGSGLARGACVDREGVDALGDQVAQRIIYEPMPRHAGRSGEASADNQHAEMASLAGTGMAHVLMAVVTHFERLGREGGTQRAFDVFGVNCHGRPDAWPAAFEFSGSGSG